MPKKKTPKPKANKWTPNQAAHREAKQRKQQSKEEAAARIVREATKDYPL
ncbi:MAG TPA: hypothetical protein VI488_00640 [Candidatus Angelobacter sp.]